MTAVMKFFGMRATEFRTEWAQLSETEKKQLRDGVADGSLSY